jgi:hypothetical protein
MQEDKRGAGNPAWKPGISGNPIGRPKRGPLDKPLTNKEVRSIELLSLCRKLKPLQAKAIQAAAMVIDNDKSADQNKLKAAALLISTYRQLLLDLYDKNYDASEAEEVNETNTPVFSLKMINNEDQKVA